MMRDGGQRVSLRRRPPINVARSQYLVPGRPLHAFVARELEGDPSGVEGLQDVNEQMAGHHVPSEVEGFVDLEKEVGHG